MAKTEYVPVTLTEHVTVTLTKREARALAEVIDGPAEFPTEYDLLDGRKRRAFLSAYRKVMRATYPTRRGQK